MPKFKKKIHELDSRFENWMYIFNNLSKMSEIPEEFTDDIFAKLFDEAI